MKMFGLYLDAPHGVDYERLNKDTNLVIPELNQDTLLGIGTDPTMYTTMNENLASNHIVQGFMIGNGGSGEDQMTTKNTDYSFINLRNPIPFRQTNEPLTDGKYLGKIRVGTHAYTNSYYIKSFEQTPHIYNGWWRDGQKWDEIDPVTQDDLGPIVLKHMWNANSFWMRMTVLSISPEKEIHKHPQSMSWVLLHMIPQQTLLDLN